MSHAEAQRRMRELIDLFDTNPLLQRQNLRRTWPEAPPEEIEARLMAWLQKREYLPN